MTVCGLLVWPRAWQADRAFQAACADRFCPGVSISYLFSVPAPLFHPRVVQRRFFFGPIRVTPALQKVGGPLRYALLFSLRVTDDAKCVPEQHVGGCSRDGTDPFFLTLLDIPAPMSRFGRGTAILPLTKLHSWQCVCSKAMEQPSSKPNPERPHANSVNGSSRKSLTCGDFCLARATGLEPATTGSTV
jgi:hypothetical protein